MRQWQYTYIVADRDEVFKVGDQVIERTSLPGYLDKMGWDGWELVGIAESRETGFWRLIFKRESNLEDL